MPYLVLVAGQLMLGLAHFSHKLFNKKSNSFLPTGALYSALISFCSLPIFFILAGFDLRPDSDLLFYSLAYGVLAALSQVMIFVAISRVNLVVYSVFGKSASILVCICGFVFFGDEVKPSTVASVLLLAVAIILPLLQIRSTEGGKSGFASLAICLIMMVNGLLISLVVKGFSALPTTTTDRGSALYFYANLVTAAVLFALLYFITRRRKSDTKVADGDLRVGIMETARRVPWKFYLLIPLTANLANIPCVTNMWCLQNMELSVYTIVLNAAESLVYFAISRFIFKEKSTKVDIAALILSTAAGIVTIL